MVVTLVDDGIRSGLELIESPCKRLVESIHVIPAEVVTRVEREGSASLAEFLPEEEEAVGPPVLVRARVAREAFVGPRCHTVSLGQSGKLRDFIEISVAEADLRLEEYRGVLRELMLKTDSETMTVGVGRVGSLVVVDKIVVIKIGDLPAFFLHISLVVIVEVIAAQIHLAVEQGSVAVQTTHPGSRDSVAWSPATAAAAHSTATSAHSLHHTSGQIIESTVVGVVAVDHHAELVLIRETSQETGSLVTPVTVSG